MATVHPSRLGISQELDRRRTRYYTWSPFSINTDLEFVPMLWGYPQVNSFSASIEQTLSPGNQVTAVLGMNEFVSFPFQSSHAQASRLLRSQTATKW
jgi:hypothetical protein